MRKMKIILPTIAVIVAIYFSLSYSGRMTGTVVDAETAKPIEGAVVLAEWTRTSGKWIGLRATNLYRAAETITDKEGKFSITSVYNPFVDRPTVVIYKTGYIAWRNDFIFPEFKKRTENTYYVPDVIKLYKFEQMYSHKKHLDFIEYGIMSLFELPITKLSNFRKAIRDENIFIENGGDSERSSK